MTKKDSYAELRELFLSYLDDKNIEIFPYTLVRQWYLEYKLRYSDKFGYSFSANVHRLLINELQKQGRIIKIKHNLWQVVKNQKVFDMHKKIFKIEEKDKDEFDKYLREKLRPKS